MHAYANWITNHPWRVLAVSLIIALALSTGLTQLSVRSDSRMLFAQKETDRLALEPFERTYGRDDTLIFVIGARTGDLFTVQRLQALNELTDAAWLLPGVTRIDSPTHFQRAQALDDGMQIAPLFRAGDSLSALHARRLKHEALLEPMLIGRLLSADGRTGRVTVNVHFPPGSVTSQAAAAMNASQALVTRFALRYPELEIGLSGSIALDHAVVEASTYDRTVLLPITVLVLLGIMVLVLRAAVVVLATLMSSALSALSAAGCAALFGIPLSSPSVAAAPIILIIACCYGLPVCMSVMRPRAKEQSNRDAVCEALITCGWPITLASLGTSVGCLALALSDLPPFAHLGLVVAAGAILAGLLTLTLLPAALCVLPWSRHASPMPVERLSMAIAEWVMLWPWRVLAIVGLATAALSTLVFTSTLDKRYAGHFSQRHDVRQATERLNEALGGFYHLAFSLDANEPGGITRLDYLEQVDRFAQWLRRQPGVTHVQGLVDILKSVNRAMNGGGHAQYRLPDSRDDAVQFLALYEMSLPWGTDLKHQLTTDKQSSRLTVSLGDVSAVSMRALQAAAHQWAHEHAPLLAPSAHATGASLLFAPIGNRNTQGADKALLVGTVLVWLIIMLRTLDLSLASTYWRLHRQQGLPPAQALREGLRKAGPGIIAMALVLSCGLACLTVSSFLINAWIGLLASATILIALCFDLLFIPALIRVCNRSAQPCVPTAENAGARSTDSSPMLQGPP